MANTHDWNFNAAYDFLVANSKDQEFIKAIDKTGDAIMETAELKSAIEMACKGEPKLANKVREFFKVAFPSSLSYGYDIYGTTSEEDNDALSYLFGFANLFVA